MGSPKGLGKGTYVLLFHLRESVRNRLGVFSGDYCYVGSAFGPGGLEARVRRHLRPSKPIRWHIDLLTSSPAFEAASLFFTPERIECEVAGALSSLLPGHPRFGSSDCSCPTHLFRVVDPDALSKQLKELGLRPIPLRGLQPDSHSSGRRTGLPVSMLL